MSASEKLKALPVSRDTAGEHSTAFLLVAALPQIAAVVEAAEKHEAKKLLPNNETLWALEAALAALEEALDEPKGWPGPVPIAPDYWESAE